MSPAVALKDETQNPPLINLVTKTMDMIRNYDALPWVVQQRAISSGEKTWDDYTFEERASCGWLMPLLFEIDDMFSGRWSWWADAILDDKIPAGPIPRIDFLDHKNMEVMSNLHDCLKKHAHMGVTISDFFDWILYGLGHAKERPRISAEVNEHWYRTFNLGLMVKYPHDYWGEILSEEKSGYWSNPHAFFPTPHTVVRFMCELQMVDNEGDAKMKSVCDPCLGTGRMLMYASNHSLFLYGQDIDRMCIKASMINAYLYMPWVAKPALNHLKDEAPVPDNVVPFMPRQKEDPVLTIQEPAERVEVKKAASSDEKPQQLFLF